MLSAATTSQPAADPARCFDCLVDPAPAEQ